MTPSRAAQEEPTSPRTPTGSADHEEAWSSTSEYVGNHDNADPTDCGMCQKIARIEREAAAATPSFDIGRLTEAFRESVTFRNIRAGAVDSEEVDCRGMALQIAHLYARLDEGSATPEQPAHTFAPYAPYSDWCSLCDKRSRDSIHRPDQPE